MSDTPNLNKRRLQRLIIIHHAIKSGRYPNNRDLQRLYIDESGDDRVSDVTVYRDIAMLRDYFHAPLEYDHKRGGYYYLDDWDLALNCITAEDVFYLSAAKTLLSSFEGTPMYNGISDVIDFVTNTQSVGKSELLKRIAIPPTPRVVIDESVWKNVIQALQNNLIVEFDYNGRWNSQDSHRRVRPYQILMDDGRYYIFGFAEERNAERIFALTRMKNVTLTDEHFTLPDNYEFSSRCGGGKFGVFMSGNSEQFVIDFYGDARQYVRECIWADDQILTEYDDEDRTQMAFSSAQFLKIREWILAQGCNAVPRAPAWFVEDWKEQVRKMAERIKEL